MSRGTAPPGSGRPPRGSGKVAWLWAVPGAGHDARGVAGSLGRAQEQAEECLKAGLDAVVESAFVVYDTRAGKNTYARTGRRSTGRMKGGRAQWTPLAAAEASR